MKAPPPSGLLQTPFVRLMLFCLLFPVLVAPALVWVWSADKITSSAPRFDWVHQVDIKAGPDASPVFLGRRDLGQRAGRSSASDVHLAAYWHDGTWWLRNVATDRRALLIYTKEGERRSREYLMRRWRLSEGDTVSFSGGTRLTLTESAGGRTGFSVAWPQTDPVHYQVRHRSGVSPRIEAQGDSADAALTGWIGGDACPAVQSPTEWARRALAVAFRAVAARNTARRLVRLGGIVGCADRIGIPEIEGGEAWIEYVEGALFIAATPGVFDTLSVQQANGMIHDLGVEAAWPVSGAIPALGADVGRLQSVVLGRTRYDVSTNAVSGILSLSAQDKIQRFVIGEVSEDRKTVSATHLDCMVTPGSRPGTFCEDGYQPRSPAQAERIAVQKWSNQPEASEPLALDLVGAAFWFAVVGGGVVALFGVLYGAFSLVAQSRLPVSGLANSGKALQIFAIGSGAAAVSRMLCLAGGVTLVGWAFLGADEPDKIVPALAIAWVLASLALVQDGIGHAVRRQVATVALTVATWVLLGLILVGGSVTLQLLAAGSPNSSWNAFATRHHVGLALFLGGVALFLGVHERFWRALLGTVFLPSRWTWRSVALLVAMLALVTFASLAMFAVGTEEGFLGLFQPSEINKFALLLVAATLFTQLEIASRYSRIGSGAYFGRWVLAVLVVALVSGFNFIAVPVRLNDYSPIVVSGLTLFALLPFAWVLISSLGLRRAAASGRLWGEPQRGALPGREDTGLSSRMPIRLRRQKLRWWRLQAEVGRRLPSVLSALGLLALLGAVGAAVGLTYGIYSDMQRPGELREFNQMERRVAVAIDHELYAEWAGQLRSAWKAMGADAQEPCLWLGPAWCERIGIDIGGQTLNLLNEAALTEVPAIQDDLISAFIHTRFGDKAVVALVSLQGVFVAAAMGAGFLVYRRCPGDIRDEGMRHFLAILAFGSGCLFLIQWSIAWSNLFSWTPIMGQPMTFVSYARSHMLGMGLPCVLSILLALRVGAPVSGRDIEQL